MAKGKKKRYFDPEGHEPPLEANVLKGKLQGCVYYFLILI